MSNAARRRFAGRDLADVDAARDGDGIDLKIGVHIGACIAVTPYGVLDCFGSNVNFATRVQALSRGGKIVGSDRLIENPAVRASLADRQVTRESAELAGLSGQTADHRVAIA